MEHQILGDPYPQSAGGGRWMILARECFSRHGASPPLRLSTSPQSLPWPDPERSPWPWRTAPYGHVQIPFEVLASHSMGSLGSSIAVSYELRATAGLVCLTRVEPLARAAWPLHVKMLARNRRREQQDCGARTASARAADPCRGRDSRGAGLQPNLPLPHRGMSCSMFLPLETCVIVYYVTSTAMKEPRCNCK